MKKQSTSRRKRNVNLNLDESIKTFFPQTSKMGVGIVTPWEKQSSLRRKSVKGEAKLPRLRLPRVAVSTPL